MGRLRGGGVVNNIIVCLRLNLQKDEFKLSKFEAVYDVFTSCIDRINSILEKVKDAYDDKENSILLSYALVASYGIVDAVVKRLIYASLQGCIYYFPKAKEIFSKKIKTELSKGEDKVNLELIAGLFIENNTKPFTIVRDNIIKGSFQSAESLKSALVLFEVLEDNQLKDIKKSFDEIFVDRNKIIHELDFDCGNILYSDATNLKIKKRTKIEVEKIINNARENSK